MMSAGRLTALTLLAICSLVPAGSIRAQEVDVAGLVHPEVAERLSLDDAQRAKIQQLLLDRAQGLVAIKDDTPAGKQEQAALTEKFRQDILAVLTPEQKEQWNAPQPTQKLMFQFRDMKWEDVLNWFASQQDLTLVMDRTPGGTFTYSDTRSYSPSEGIDLLNSVLMTRGFTLVRREKMLVVMELSANIPLELLPRVPLEQLDERGRFEIVSVLFPLAGRPVDAVLQEVKPYLSSYGRAIPLARGGQLLVVETAGKMSTINELIASVPVPKENPKAEATPQPVFAAYALGELDSGAALETIRKLIPSEQITVDARTGVLSAFVIPAQQLAIKSAIDQMQASHAELPDAETVAYRFSGMKPEELQRQIAALAPRAILTVTSDRALVTADAADQQIVRSALNALDIQPVAVDRTLKVFEVSKSGAEQVATALRTFLPNSFVVSNAATGNVLVRGSQQDLQLAQDVVDMWRASQTTAAAELHALALDRPATAVWLTTVKQIVPDATLWLSESLPNVPQHLMLLGSKQDFATVEKILPQLLSVLPEADHRELKIYPLTENQRARQITLATLPSELSDIKLVTGQSGQELLVWAAPEQHAALAELLKQLDQPLTTTTVVPRSYSLNVQSTATVTTLLAAEFPTVQLTFNAAGDELTVLATPDQHARIAARVAEFNAELPSKPELLLKIYPLTENQRARQITLATLPSELSDIKLVTGQSGQELLVWATPEQHTAFAELLNQFDQPLATATIVPKSYSLKVQNAATVTTLLTAEFPTVQLTINTAGDELTVLASPDQHARIAERVAEFNAELPSKPELLVESYAVDGMTAVSLQQALLPLLTTAQTTLDSRGERLFIRADAETHAELHELAAALGAKPVAGRQKVVLAYPLANAAATNVKLLLDQIVRDATVLADDKLRQVVVTGSLETQAQVKAAIDQIDRTGSVRQAAVIHSYDAGQLTASALLPTLQAMWPNTQLTVDSASNQVVASGTPEEHEQLAAAFEQLTSAAGGDAQLAKTYPVPFGEMSTLSSVLKQLAPRALISSDPISRTVTVWATPPQQKLVEQALEALSQTARDAQQPATYMVKPTQLLAIQTSLRTLFPAAVSTSDPTTGQLVVVASQDVQTRIASVVEMLSNGSNSDETTTKVFTFDPKQVELSNVMVALKSTIPAQVLLESNPANHTLLAIGSAEDLERVSQQIQRLLEQMPEPDVMSSVVYPLRHANPLAAVTVLARLLPLSTLAPDVASKTISATAKAEDHKTIAEFLIGFDQPAANDKQTRVFAIGNGDAASLQVAIKEFSAEVFVTADRATNSLIVTATPEELDQIGEIVDQVEKGGSDAQVAKAYPVPFGEMSTLSSVLKQLAPRALISSDPISRTLTVWATPPQQKLVEQALEALSQTASDAQQPATYMVKPTQLLAIQTSLRTLFPAAVSTSDPTTGQLVVVASQDVQTRIASVVEMLSNGSSADETTTKVFTFDPKQAELSNILVALKSTIPAQVRLESNPVNHTLLAIGSAEDLERVSQQIQRLLEQMPEPDVMSSVVYPLRHANPLAAVTVLARLLPLSTLAPDVASKTISATAKAEDHKTIAEFLIGFDQPVVNDKQTHVYRLQRGNGRGLSFVLSSLMPDATFYGSPESGGLVATALPEQHERIAAIVKEFDNDREDAETRVFVVGNGSAASLQVAIKNFSADVAVTADQATNSLIVTATPEELDQIGEIVDQVESGGSQPRTTRFYPVLGSEPVALSRALEASFTKATFSADSAGGGLFATATQEVQAELAKVIDELNAQPTRLPTLKSFTLKHASPEVVAHALEDAFGRRSLAGVSFNRETRSVFVVGSRDDLQVAQTLVEQIDVLGSTSDSRKLRVFSLGGADGRSITDAIKNLFPESSAPVDVRYDPLNEQLFVVGEPEQVKLVEEMLEQLTPPDRQLEIVQLDATDPYSFKLAADALFEDEPVNSAPSITIDSAQQRVIIRATDAQLVSLRKLLQQMGESPLGGSVGSPARLRFIPVHRNSDKLLNEIRRLWPAAGGNALEVIRPAGKSNDANYDTDNEPSSRKGDGKDTLEEKMPAAKLTSAPQASPLDTNTPNEAAISDDKTSDGSSTVAPPETADDSTGNGAVGSGDAGNAPKLPAIVVVVGDEQWTVASADTQALDQFQRLLDTLLSPRVEPYSTTGNYSVYLLRHAGADQVQELLSDLFRPERGRSSAVSDLMQRVKIVADSRINALIVSGNRQDRRTVEELLGVLDSEDLLDSLQQITPTTLALESASANNVEAILRDVYRSQLSSGAGRRPVPIPEGVSSDVASLLQQLNAQSSGPLLTMSIDETSNSIIFRAPIELTTEIRSFVESLDRKSQETPSKRVDLIRLQSTNAKSLQQALKILLAK